MYEFSTGHNKTLRLQVDERGITFLYNNPHGKPGRTLQVSQGWTSIHTLLARLKNKQRYYSMDASLSIWKEGKELKVKFYALNTAFQDTLTFSDAAAARILCLLRNLPNLN